MQRLGPFGKLRGVRRHRQVLDRGALGKAGDEIDEAAAQQGFPAREADLAHPEFAEGVDGALDLVEGEDVLLGQPCVGLLRHAVGAAQVAAVDDGEAQTFERAAEEIVNRAAVGVRAHAEVRG